jgi:hypothetical protein
MNEFDIILIEREREFLILNNILFVLLKKKKRGIYLSFKKICEIYSVSGISQSVTNSTSVSLFKSDISINTPSSSPRVLDNPVSFSIPSSYQNSMVSRGSTVIKNT